MSRFDTSIRRRTLLKAGAALGASQVIAAPFIVTALGDEPVKIGMVNPLTGVLSAFTYGISLPSAATTSNSDTRPKVE